MSSPATNRFLILAAAVLFSTGGAAIKATAFGPWQVACFRSAVAAIVLLLLLPAARRGWSWRVLPAAAAYAATLILFVLATKLTTAANAIFLQDTAPVYVLLAGPLLLREPLRRSDLVLAAVVAGGMALFFLGREHALTAPEPFRGNICALLSGVAWAGTLLSLRWLGKHSTGEGAATMVAAGNVLAFAVSLPMALPLHRAAASDLLVIAYLGVFQIGLAYFCLTRAMRHVPAFEASTLLLAEPVLNPVWAWLVHGERPTPWAIAGGALILSATLFHTWREARRAAPAL
jgi:DME family drug/metabolite transporter